MCAIEEDRVVNVCVGQRGMFVLVQAEEEETEAEDQTQQEVTCACGGQ